MKPERKYAPVHDNHHLLRIAETLSSHPQNNRYEQVSYYPH